MAGSYPSPFEGQPTAEQNAQAGQGTPHTMPATHLSYEQDLALFPQQVPNVAALRQWMPNPGDTNLTCITQGEITPGDGFGSVYAWNPASTAADNGLTIVNPTANTGNGRWLAISIGGSASFFVKGTVGLVTLTLPRTNFFVDTTEGVAALTLPSPGVPNREVYVDDYLGNASQYPVTITVDAIGAAASICGQPNYLLNGDFYNATFVDNGTTWSKKPWP